MPRRKSPFFQIFGYTQTRKTDPTKTIFFFIRSAVAFCFPIDAILPHKHADGLGKRRSPHGLH
jgi:hypothetical protein